MDVRSAAREGGEVTANFSEAENLARIIAWQEKARLRGVLLFRASFEWHPDDSLTYLGYDVAEYIEIYATRAEPTEFGMTPDELRTAAAFYSVDMSASLFTVANDGRLRYAEMSPAKWIAGQARYLEMKERHV